MKIKKRLFITLISTSVLAILLILGLVWFFSFNRGLLIYRILFGVALLALLGIIAVVSLGIGGIVLTIWRAKTIPPMQSFIRMAINLLFPLALGMGKLFGIERDVIKSSFIEVNNQLVRSQRVVVPGDRVIILAPHCLQRTECPHKVTIEVQNCRRCGRCCISGLRELADQFGCQLAVATGGTLARKFIEQYHPRAVVAVACERDLTSGIMDATPLPVLGILNRRPEGPCFNTQVDLEAVAKAINWFIKGGE